MRRPGLAVVCALALAVSLAGCGAAPHRPAVPSGTAAGGTSASGLTTAGVTTTERATTTATATATQPSTTAPTTSSTGTADTGPLTVPPAGSLVLFFGDSYTLGTGASSPQAGYAPLTAAALGWRTDLEAVGGTGFVARAEEGLAYPQRAAALPVARPALVVVEGGLNDVLLREDPAAVAAAARDTVALFRQRWPDVPLVVLGPVPVPRADRALLRDVDARLAAVVGADRYVSPRQLGWPISGYATADGIHPDDAGYRVLADSFVSAVRSLGN